MPLCSACGTDVEKYANGKKCRTCYNAYMADYMLKRYHRRRAEAIVELGGKCVRCSSVEALEIDHADRLSKEYDLGKLFTQGERWYREELKKCQLLCGVCHQAKTTSELSVGHGGGVSGKKNCKCSPCKAKKAEYMRA